MEREYILNYIGDDDSTNFCAKKIIRIDDLIKQLEDIKKEKGNLVVLAPRISSCGEVIEDTPPILEVYDAEIFEPIENMKITDGVVIVLGEGSK